MIDKAEGPSLLRVARPRECNTQQPPLMCATTGATTTQQTSLKAASMLILERNKLCNNHATTTQKGTQQPPLKNDELVASELGAIAQVLPDDLDRLIDIVARHYRCPNEEIAEMKAAATADLGGAMQSFRALAGAIPLPPAIEARRQRVLAMLDKNPGTRLALVTDTQAEPESVIVTVGVRDKGTADLRIPRERYDGLKVLALIESIGGGCPVQGR